MRILSVQHALPSCEVTNRALIERILAHQEFRVSSDERPAFQFALEQYFKRSGAVTRYHRARSERAFDLGMVAAERALASADVEAEEIDLLIYVGVGRGFLEPANANAFQAALGLSNATCFDILDACASWLRAVDVYGRVSQYLESLSLVNSVAVDRVHGEDVLFSLELRADPDRLASAINLGKVLFPEESDYPVQMPGTIVYRYRQ